MKGYILKSVTVDGYSLYWDGTGWQNDKSRSVIYPCKRAVQMELDHLPNKYMPGNLEQFKAELVHYDFVSGNPVEERQKEIVQAVDLFRAFRGDEPEWVDSFDIPVYSTCMLIGELDGVLYSTVRDNNPEQYIHEFRKNSRPLLASSFDGKQLYILGGGYDFTDRGIVDK